MEHKRKTSTKRRVQGLRNAPVRTSILLMIVASVMGCADMGKKAPANKPIDADQPLSQSASSLAKGEIEPDEVVDAQAIKYRGNDQVVGLPPARDPISFVGDAVALSFENAPLSEVTHAILSDVLGIDYLVDGPIPGEVTLRTRTPIERDQLLSVLESLLKANNVLLIRGRDNRFIVSSSQAAAQLVPRVVSRDEQVAGYSTMVIPLQYISAGGMAEILKPLAEEKALVRVDNTRNLLMLAGTKAQLSGWLEIIETFDVDMLEGMSVGLFPLQYSGVEELVEALNQLLTEASAEEGAGGLTDIVRVMPFVRLNSVMVITPRAHYLDRMEIWIERLDRAPENGAEKRLYVYPVQNTTASRLAMLLTSIYSGGAQRGSGRSALDNRNTAPGMNQESIGGGNSRGGTGRNGNNNNRRNGSGTRGGSGGGTTVSALQLDPGNGDGNDEGAEVRVVADEENNSLMIYSTGMQYKTIKAAVEKLDVPPTQVLIEASIVEVTLNDQLKYGLEWTFNNQLGGSDYSGIGVISDGNFNFGGAEGAVAQLAQGFSYTVSGGSGVVAVLRALATESLVNVISTPSVMVLDNNVATIQVGDQVPINSGSTVTNGGNTIQNISYKDTGVQLTVRPSVNAGGLVTLDVLQTVTDVGNIDVTGNRRFLERSIESRVAVRSGESVVLGGLIRENAANNENGVPWLHKAPIIGPLFGTTEKTRDRTELLVILTPRALYNDEELRQASDEMRDQIRNFELIEQ
ncbi:type II secretion system secretin GspD [Luminiphilus sp.]|nr:type II secretion system secretin GspD [Luminiphilus sp.]MDA9581262.1 type II secretion system secretin GspD [Luminiphilus sp.]